MKILKGIGLVFLNLIMLLLMIVFAPILLLIFAIDDLRKNKNWRQLCKRLYFNFW